MTTNLSAQSQNYYYGKDRFKWSRLPPHETTAHNVVQVPRVRPAAQGPLGPIDLFQLIFDQRMLNTVLIWTNKKLEEFQTRYPKYFAFSQTNPVELKNFLALLIYSAIFKSNKENLLSLFATDGTGRGIHPKTDSWHCSWRFTLMMLLTVKPEDKLILLVSSLTYYKHLFVQNSQNYH